MTAQLIVKTREQLRSWFEKHHATESKVFLISWKRHTGKPFLTHRQQMEEAICFGWIDTTAKRLDEDRYGRYFVPRTDKSRWSNNTLSYAKQMVEEKRMAPAGMKRYKEGLAKPVIDHEPTHKGELPDDLERALAKNPLAKKNFENFAPSYRKNYSRWVDRGKMAATREKRIKEVIARSKKNLKPGL